MRVSFSLLPLLLLVACEIDSGLNATSNKTGFDEGDSGFDPSGDTDSDGVTDEVCNGEDDDGDGEVDEGFPDDDGNGRVDCLDEDCEALDLGEAGSVAIDPVCESTSGAPVADPWNVAVKWTVDTVTGGYDQSATTPVMGNLDDDDGDGDIDEDDTPDVLTNVIDSSFAKAAIVAFDGATGAEKWVYAGAGFASGVAVADVDADGTPDVLGYDSAGHPIALSNTGALKWTGNSTANLGYLPLISVADLDEDGAPEVIAYDTVYNGNTGKKKFQMSAGSATYAIAAIGDVDLDGDQELAFAGKLYDSDGSLLWNSGEGGSYGMWPIIIQADGDAEAEIGFVGNQWTLWDHDGSNIYKRTYGTAQPGPPCAGDFDGDGMAEVAWGASATFVEYELDGTKVWSVPMDDSSGLAGCSGYDVDGAGGLEILFADQSTFKIFDGATGATNYTNSKHSSGTAFEYPSVADIDHDGHAEIVFVSNKVIGPAAHAVTVLEHAGGGWPASGSTWGIHDFAITNLNPDGSVPPSPDPYWNKYNVYRARVASDQPGTPDLVPDITDVCVADCDAGPVAVGAWVWNAGSVDVEAGAVLELYAVDGGSERLVGTEVLPAIAAGTSIEGIEFTLEIADLGGEGFRAKVDTSGAVSECDEANNEADWSDTVCP